MKRYQRAQKFRSDGSPRRGSHTLNPPTFLNLYRVHALSVETRKLVHGRKISTRAKRLEATARRVAGRTLEIHKPFETCIGSVFCRWKTKAGVRVQKYQRAQKFRGGKSLRRESPTYGSQTHLNLRMVCVLSVKNESWRTGKTSTRAKV